LYRLYPKDSLPDQVGEEYQQTYKMEVIAGCYVYGTIQRQIYEPFKVGNPTIYKSYLLRHLQWELATDHGFLN